MRRKFKIEPQDCSSKKCATEYLWGSVDVNKDSFWNIIESDDNWITFINSKHVLKKLHGADSMEAWDNRPKFHVGLAADNVANGITVVLDVLKRHQWTRFKIMTPALHRAVEEGKSDQYGKTVTIYLSEKAVNDPKLCKTLCDDIEQALKNANIKAPAKRANQSARADYLALEMMYVTVAPPREQRFSYPPTSEDYKFDNFWSTFFVQHAIVENDRIASGSCAKIFKKKNKDLSPSGDPRVEEPLYAITDEHKQRQDAALNTLNQVEEKLSAQYGLSKQKNEVVKQCFATPRQIMQCPRSSLPLSSDDINRYIATAAIDAYIAMRNSTSPFPGFNKNDKITAAEKLKTCIAAPTTCLDPFTKSEIEAIVETHSFRNKDSNLCATARIIFHTPVIDALTEHLKTMKQGDTVTLTGLGDNLTLADGEWSWKRGQSVPVDKKNSATCNASFFNQRALPETKAYDDTLRAIKNSLERIATDVKNSPEDKKTAATLSNAINQQLTNPQTPTAFSAVCKSAQPKTHQSTAVWGCFTRLQTATAAQQPSIVSQPSLREID